LSASIRYGVEWFDDWWIGINQEGSDGCLVELLSRNSHRGNEENHVELHSG
jgi:hypothetical protein